MRRHARLIAEAGFVVLFWTAVALLALGGL